MSNNGFNKNINFDTTNTTLTTHNNNSKGTLVKSIKNQKGTASFLVQGDPTGRLDTITSAY